MAIERINPAELAAPGMYSHVVVAAGTRMVFVAGQVSEDGEGNLVGPGDMAVQAGQAFANLGHALAAAGARPEDVAKLTIYVAGYEERHLPAIVRGMESLFGDHRPADALVGVERLAHPGCMIEVDAVAVTEQR
jgi:enamine deaminase RidA (YjgF/YER057c/UK114 family)